MIKITRNEVDLLFLLKKLKTTKAGAIISYIGLVRGENKGKKVTFMKIKAQKGAEEELKDIEKEIRNKFAIEDIIIVRRTGKLKVGETILIIGISAVHRKEAFSACKFAVDKLKKMKKIEESES